MVARLFAVVDRTAAGTLVFVVEDVAAVVGVEIEPVAVGDAPGEFAVEVVEVVVPVQALGFQDRGEEHRVHAASADGIGQLVLDDGPFEVQAVADGSHAHRAVRLLHVAVVGADVDDGGDAAAVPGGEGALVEGDLLDGLRLEDAEDAQQVFGVVEGDSVEKKQVLLRPASAHINAGESFHSGLHARHQLYGLQHVRLPEESWSLLDHRHGHLDRAHLGGENACVLGGHHGGAVELQVGVESDVYGGVLLEIDRERLIGVSHIGEG